MRSHAAGLALSWPASLTKIFGSGSAPMLSPAPLGVTYYSQGSLAPDSTASWNSLPGGGGSSPTDFTNNGDIFIIQSGHNMSTTAAWSVTGSGATIQVGSGGTLTANNLVSVANFVVADTGTYVHNAVSGTANGSAGDIPGSLSRSFTSNSNVTFQKWGNAGTSLATLPNLSWGNLTINVTTLAAAWNQQGNLQTVNGNLTIQASGGQEFRLSGNTAFTLTIGGNLAISGGTLNLSNGNGTPATMTVNIGGNFSQTGGVFTSAPASGTPQTPTVAFSGGLSSATFTQSAGTFTITNINWSIASGKTVQFNNNFTMPGSRSFTIVSGGVLAEAALFLNGGTVTVNGELRVAEGGSPNGNSYTYGSGATLSYTGTSTQTSTSTEFPSSNGPTNLTISNAANVGLHAARTINGTLKLTSGALTSASNLTLGNGATISRDTGSLSAAPTFTTSVNVTYTGSTAATTGPEIPTSSSVLSQLTVNNTGGVTLGANATANGASSIGSGATLDTSTFTLATANTFANSGTVNVNGTFQINQGGVPSGNNFVYGGSSTLLFNNSSNFTVTNTEPSWPVTNGPFNVTVQGGVIMSSAPRSIGGLLKLTNILFNGNQITVNGTCQLVSGGFANNGPFYGSSALLKYASGGNPNAGLEWSTTSGAGYPHDVQLSSNTNLSIGLIPTTTRQISGTLTIDSGSALSMNAMTASLTTLGGISNSGTLTLSSASGGNLNVGGNLTTTTFTSNGRTLSFTGSSGQTWTDSTGGQDFGAVQITGAGGVTLGSNITVGGASSISSGATLNTSTFALNLGNTLTNSGTFNVNGTLRLKSGGSVNTNAPAYGAASTLDFDTGGTFNTGVEFPSTGVANVTISSTTQLNLDGDKTISGTFAVGTAKLYTSGGNFWDVSADSITLGAGEMHVRNLTTTTSLVVTNNTVDNKGRIDLYSGDWHVNGYADNGTKEATVVFNGVGTDTIYTPTTFTRLWPNADVSVDLAADVTVNRSLQVNNTRFKTNSFTCTLGSNSIGVGRVTGYVIGNLKKNFSSAQSFTMPMGTDNGYSPVVLNVTSGTGSVTVKAVQGNQPNVPVPTKALSRYWTLSGTGVTTDITFSYLDGDIPGTATEANFVIQKRDTSYSQPGGSVNTGANTATITGVTSFSDWTLAEPSAFCPSSFTVNNNGDDGDGALGDGFCETVTGNGICTLRAAIQEANALTSCGAITINFAGGLSGGTITLSSSNEIQILHPVTINGPGANLLTIDGGTGSNRIFYIGSYAVTISGVTMQNGHGGGSGIDGIGGAIYADHSTLTLDSVVVKNNTASSSSGGVYYGLGSNHRIINSTFTGNSSLQCGAFFKASSNGLYMANSTISNNSVTIAGTIAGAGICDYGTGMVVRNSTITNNHADSGGWGGGIYVNGSLNLGNTIVAGNSATGGFGPDLFVGGGSITTVGYNLVGDNSQTGSAFPAGTPNGNNDWVGTAGNLVDPQLAGLTNNGGPTPTHALNTGSVAIDHGSNALAVDPFDSGALSFDQRGTGYSRILGGTVDIGAYEAPDTTAPTIVYTPLANTSLTSNRVLSTTITDGSGVPTSGTGLPVIYYRKGASGSYATNQCSFVSGSSYNCTIDYSQVTGGSVTVGDTIQYFVVAQDSAATPNVTSNPSTLASGFTASPPAVSTPTTAPNTYTIVTAKYRTRTTGAWNDFNTWDIDTGSGFAAAASGQTPTSADDTIEIRSPHTVTVTNSVSADQLTIDAGGEINVNDGITLTLNDGTSTDLTVNGILDIRGAGKTSGAGSFALSSGAQLNIGSPDGITSGTTASGSIQNTGGRTFDPAASYSYVGSANQATGNALPASVNNFQVANTGGTSDNIVTLGADLTINGTLTLTNGAMSIGAHTLTLNGAVSYGAGLLAGGATSNITVDGSGASTAITNITLNNFTINRANGITVSCGCAAEGTVTVTGTLTLTSGKVTTTSSTLLVVSNTSASAISGGSSSSYIKGPLARALPASLVTGSTYSFPVGKGTFNPFEMVNPTTIGAATIQAEVFDANSGGTAGANLLSLNTNRYWEGKVTSGSFTNTKVRLTDSSLIATSKIGKSSAVGGTYDSIGGEVTGSTVTSNTITSFSFFNIGNGGNTISGTLLDANGNPITTSKTIRLLQNGTDKGAVATTAGTGEYSFTTLTLAAGDRIAVFVDNETEKGATVTLSGTADISGLNIYQNQLVVRSDSGASISNANLKNAQGGSPDTDITAVYTVDGSNLLTTKPGIGLQIWFGSTYDPGNNIIDGGNWTNNGTFVPYGVMFNGTANQTIGGNNSTTFTTLTISNTGTSPNNVVSLDGSSGASTVTVDVFSVTSGVFDQGTGSASVNLITNVSGTVASVSSGATWRNIGTGDVTLSGDISNSGTINLNANGTSCGDTDDILIRSSVDGTQRSWSGTGTFSLTDVDIKDQKVIAPPAAIVVASGNNAGNNNGFVFTSTLVGCAAGNYKWIGGTTGAATDWTVPTNWTPTRTTPNTGDVLTFDGSITPSPTVTNVPTQEIAALHLTNGVNGVTLNASGTNTLTMSGTTGNDLSVPSGTLLTLAGANPLTLSLTGSTSGGTQATIAGQIIFQDSAHHLVGSNSGEIKFASGGTFTTTTGHSGFPFGSGAGGVNGAGSSVEFQSGSSANFAGSTGDPFGSSGSPVTTFDSGSTETFYTSTALSYGNRTYGNLVLDGSQPYSGGSTSSPLTVFNDFTLQSGSSFTLSSSAGGDLNLLGNFTDNNASGSHFIANGRAVIFQGGAATQTINRPGVPTESFDDFTLSKTGGSVKPTGDLNVIINGALQFNGTTDVLELTAGGLILNGTVGGSNSSGGLKGDLVPSSTVSIGGASAAGTLRFVSGGEFLTSLTVNRTSSGSVTLGSNLTIGQPSGTPFGALVLTAGTVNTGSNTLSLNPNVAVSRTNGYVIGKVKRTFAANGSFTFPVGTATGYSPVDTNVTSFAANAALTVKAVDGKQPNITGTKALQRYWTISNTNAVTADLTFHYLLGDVVGNESLYKIFKYDGAFTQLNPDALNTGSHFATRNGVSSFSDWTLAEPGSVNPPTLGVYPNTGVALSGNTTVLPAPSPSPSAPTNTTSIDVSTSTNFKGKLEGDPSTGVVRVTDAHPAGTYTISVTAFNSGTGPTTRTFTLTVTTPTTCTPVSFAAAANFAVGTNPHSVAVGDFNGDGSQDLAVANNNSNNVSILLGTGTGSFIAATNFGVGSNPVSVAVGDFNGDGKQDLAVANEGSNNVSILLGNGTGGFGAATNFGVGSTPSSVAVGDFNGNGRQDLAVANAGSNNVSVLLGDGTGSFSAATTFTVGDRPLSVAVGDFNDDGKQDLAVANRNGNNVSILLGDGTGSFSDATTFNVGSFPRSVAVGDFNGDGKQDLAVANEGSNNVSILLGNGTGGFGAATNFDVGSFPVSVAVGDFDGGNQDLAVANAGSSNVSILLGDGAGSFSAATNFTVGSSPLSVAVGDFTGDGKQDLAAANQGSSSVSVLLRQCAPTITNNTGMTVNEGSTGNTIASTKLKVSDVDNTDAQLTFTLGATPAHGTLKKSGSALVTSSTFTQDDINNNLLTYDHDGSETTADSFTFTVSDGAGGSIGSTTFNITVTSVNDPPTLTTNAGLTVVTGSTGTIDNTKLLVSDPDNSATQLTFTIGTATAHGTLKKSASNLSSGGNFTQDDINNSRITYVHNGDTANGDSFTFTVSDGAGGSISSTTFNISINCISNPVVTNTNDSGAGSLRDAIISACVGSTITFDPTVFNPAGGPYTITLTSGELVINKNLTITGPGANKLTVQRSTADGTPNFRIFTINSGQSVTISGLTISNGNLSSVSGGGLVNSGVLTLSNIIVTGNTAIDAGGIFNSGTLALTNSTVNGNSAGGTAGGIFNQSGGTLTLTNSTVSGNTGFGSAGGISNGGTLSLMNSTLSANTATTGSGGGIFNQSSGTLTLTNSTLSGNSAATGGALANVLGTVTLTNCTLSGNAASGGSGGGGISNTGTTNLKNAIVANNTTSATGPDLKGSFTSQDYNLIGNTSGANLAGTITHNITNVNALLGALANNGGPTMTHALLPGSPAINAGDNCVVLASGSGGCLATPLTTDQRGFARQVNTTVDIGAFESRGFTIAATPPTPQTATITTAFGSPLVATVSSASGEPVAGGVVTFTAPASGASGTFTGGVTTVMVTTNSSGVATSPTFTANGTAGGPYTVTASANGITGSANFSLTNAQAPTSTAVTSSVNPSDFSESVTFTATVSTTAGITPTGTVQLMDGTNSLGSLSCSPAGPVNTCRAVFSTSTLTSGLHTITANYSDPNANFTSSSGTLSAGQVVRARPSLSINDVSMSEGDSGTKNFVFNVTLSAASHLQVTVNFATADGTATTTDLDYQSNSGPLTFNAGDTTKTITVLVNGDQKFEPNETFFVNLSAPTNATISDNQGLGTIVNDDAQGGIITFSQSNYDVGESDGLVTITVNRTGDTSGSATVDYATPDDSDATTAVEPCATTNGFASPRCDFTTALGTLQFAPGDTQKTFILLISQDNFREGPEMLTLTLSHLTGGAVFGPRSTATVTIADDASEPTQNPVDDTSSFVRQHYHDFFNREADAPGLAFWKDNIDKCNDPARRPAGLTAEQCIEVFRVNTSAAFYLSIEFQQTGYLVERLYKASYGDADGTSKLSGTAQNIKVPIVRFSEFLPDTQKIGQGVVVNQGDWQTQLENNKVAFIAAFVQRQRFTSIFGSISNAQFVDQLNLNAGNPLSQSDRDQLLADLNNNQKTRAQVLRAVAEHPNLVNAEFNRAFVLMQYFGYLRRNPNAKQDTDYTGFEFWLTKLNSFNGNFENAEMVKAFISSDEYRHRSGQ